MRTTITILTLAMTLMMGCSKSKDDTTPKNEPAQTQAAEEQAAEQEQPKEMPADYIDPVEKTWSSALTAVVTCMQQVADEQKLRGIEGYIIVKARIGASEHPSAVEIKEVKMKKLGKEEEVKVTGFEKCVKESIASLSFPTWGYEVWDEHSYPITIMY